MSVEDGDKNSLNRANFNVAKRAKLAHLLQKPKLQQRGCYPVPTTIYY